MVTDFGWGHLQIDATSLYLLMLAEMTAAGNISKIIPFFTTTGNIKTGQRCCLTFLHVHAKPQQWKKEESEKLEGDGD